MQRQALEELIGQLREIQSKLDLMGLWKAAVDIEQAVTKIAEAPLTLATSDAQ